VLYKPKNIYIYIYHFYKIELLSLRIRHDVPESRIPVYISTVYYDDPNEIEFN
jgi:hypothetical protein